MGARKKIGAGDDDNAEVQKSQSELIAEALSLAEPWRCNFYLMKKKRLCRLNKVKGQPYCAEHCEVERRPCPLDPKHTVAVGKLEEHLKKCNSRPPTEDYYNPGANSVSSTSKNEGDGVSAEEDLNLLTMTQEEKVDVILKLIKLHQARVPVIPDRFGVHDFLHSDFVRTDVGESAIRHSTQIASLAKLLDDHNLLRDSTCFIEFGSGRGGLSYGLARVVKGKGLRGCKFFLIDRTSPRYKKENYCLRDSGYDKVPIERIKLSIEDLVVGKLPGIQEFQNIVGVTKHLCGSGTDVALRSLLDPQSNSERGKVKGLVFATCCHHRIEYDNFVGNELLPDEFSRGKFRPLRQIAAWATNGDYESTYLKDLSSVSGETMKFLDKLEQEEGTRYAEVKLKKTVGRLVKEVMDRCRADHINDNCRDIKLKCELVNYVDMTTTRENVAILAYQDDS